MTIPNFFRASLSQAAAEGPQHEIVFQQAGAITRPGAKLLHIAQASSTGWKIKTKNE